MVPPSGVRGEMQQWWPVFGDGDGSILTIFTLWHGLAVVWLLFNIPSFYPVSKFCSSAFPVTLILFCQNPAFKLPN